MNGSENQTKGTTAERIRPGENVLIFPWRKLHKINKITQVKLLARFFEAERTR